MAAWFWYAVVAAVLYGAHQIFTRMAADHIGEGLGGFVVEASAAFSILIYLGILWFSGRWNQQSSAQGVFYSVLTGICVGYWWQTGAATRDYFYAGAVIEREINERLVLGAELFGNSPREHGVRSELAFNVGGTLKLNEHLNLLFSGGRDIVGDTQAMTYIGLQLLTK